MIITKTPYRFSLFGGGTDYQPWFDKKGGLLIASAMARYCYITVRRLPPFFEHKSRVVYSKVEEVEDHNQINHPSINQCLRFMNVTEGVEIHHDGDMPARSGIGSSSSFTVGLLNALHALQHRMVPTSQLAAEAIEVEQDWIKEDVGIQDQIMASYGGIRVIDISPGGRYSVKPLICSPDYLQAFESHILLGFSGISRMSVEFAKAQIQSIESGSSHNNLDEILSLAQEALSLFQKQANLEEIGKLLNRSWEMKRALAQGISNSQIDEIYKKACANGAFGGKLMGAGGGGFVYFLAPPYKHEQIKAALPEIKVWVPFKFDNAGSQTIFHSES